MMEFGSVFGHAVVYEKFNEGKKGKYLLTFSGEEAKAAFGPKGEFDMVFKPSDQFASSPWSMDVKVQNGDEVISTMWEKVERKACPMDCETCVSWQNVNVCKAPRLSGATCLRVAKFRCGKCKKRKYCSAQCQKLDWEKHGRECTC